MQRYIAEFIGALFLVYVIISTGDVIAIGVAFTIIIALISNISGGHINPAVTLAMFLANKIPKMDVLPYIIAHIAGGLTAIELYKLTK